MPAESPVGLGAADLLGQAVDAAGAEPRRRDAARAQGLAIVGARYELTSRLVRKVP